MPNNHKVNKFVKDTISVVFSNVLVLFSSIVTGLVIPGLLGVTEYGYYRTFTLYMGYTALLHFGFIDGILMVFAGEEYSEIDKKSFRTITRFYYMMQLFMSIIIMAIALFLMTGTSRLIFSFVALDTFAVNVTMYYQYVSQCTMRFKELSIRKILQAIFKILGVILLYFLYRFKVISAITVSAYLIALVLIDFGLLCWYIYSYKDITFGRGSRLSDNLVNIGLLFKKGIMLTIAYQVAYLIFSIDSQFVVTLFDTDTYALYAFAYSLISMVTTVISAVSYVMFPIMKQKSNKENIQMFSDSITLVVSTVFAAHLGYYFLKAFVAICLPKYIESLQYVRILFPGLAVSCCISIIIFTYYKVFDKNHIYFGIGCLVLALAALFNGIAYMGFHSPAAISIASIVTLLIWLILTEIYFIMKYKVSWKKNFSYILIMACLFWILTSERINVIVSFGLYLLCFSGVTYIYNGKTLMKYLRKISH